MLEYIKVVPTTGIEPVNLLRGWDLKSRSVDRLDTLAEVPMTGLAPVNSYESGSLDRCLCCSATSACVYDVCLCIYRLR